MGEELQSLSETFVKLSLKSVVGAGRIVSVIVRRSNPIPLQLARANVPQSGRRLSEELSAVKPANLLKHLSWINDHRSGSWSCGDRV